MRRKLRVLVGALGLTLATAAQAQPPVTLDLGTLTAGTPVGFNTGGTGVGQTKWYKFTLAQPVTYQALRFLDIRTANSGLDDDCQIAVYTSAGVRVATDNDDDVNFDSQLTFGTGEGLSPILGASVTNGRDGDLPAGTYYLGITRWEATFNASGFSVTPDASGFPGASADVTVSLGDTTPQAPFTFIDLGTLTTGATITRADALGSNEVKWYKVVLPAASDASGSFVDIDTETTTLLPANDPRMRLYGVNGAIQSVVSIPDGVSPASNVLNDEDDGTDLQCQLTFGASGAPRPAPGNGLAYNGRDGALRPGVYYLTVSSVPTSPVNLIIQGSANFSTTSTSTNTGTVRIKLRAGTTANTAPTGVGVGVPNWAAVGTSTDVLRVTVTPGANPASTGLAVTVNTASLGGGVVSLRDDGVAPDTTANDRIFNGFLPVPAGAPTGAATLPFTITDAQGRSGGGSIALTIFGPAPGCSAGGESVSGVNIRSEGTAGAGSNGVLGFAPAGSGLIGSVKLSGRYIPNDFFAFEASLQIIPPSGLPITAFPINDFDNAGRPRDVVDLEIPLPCPIAANSGTWTFRFYELSDTSAGDDGVWTSVCVTLIPQPTDPTLWNGDRCSVDAGEGTASAQTPAGSGPLATIKGFMEAGGSDLFAIQICDPVNFSASTLPGTGIDTQLFLFNSAGVGVIANDNINGATTQSTINNSGNWLAGPGLYYLGISAYDRDPTDSGGETIWALGGPRTGILVPDGLAASNPLGGWITLQAGPTGVYTITLTGVCYPGATPTGCNLADITEIGGSVEAPGNPDGQLTVDDIILFVNLFSDGTGCPAAAPCNRADITGIGGPPEASDGQLTVDDVIAFFNAFSEGCV